MARLNLTKSAIERLDPPANNRDYHYDSKVNGLAVCVTPAGTKTFYVVKRVDRKVEFIRIGPWPQLTVENARTEAAKINGELASGVNRAEKRRVNHQAPTLGQVFDEYIETPTRGKAKRPRSPKTIKDYKWQFKAHLEPWRDCQLSKITRANVELLHGQIGKGNGEYLANRVLALLKAVLNYAVEQEYYPLNVAARIRGFEERSRDRFVTAEELPRFWAAVESEIAADFYKLSLLTGARQANVLAARWDQINLDAALWLIPKTKGGAPLTVPLSAAAVEVFRRRKAASKSEWVFTRADEVTGPMPAPRHGWARVLLKAGIDGLRLHDLRRSLASWQASTGANLTVIGKSLGHNSVQATKIYAHADLSSVRDSVETATAAILAAAKPKPAKSASEATVAKRITTAAKAATIVELHTDQEHADVEPPGPCPYPAGDPRVAELPAKIAEKQVGSLPEGGVLRVMIGDDAYISTLKKREAMMLPDAIRGRKIAAATSSGGKAKAKEHSLKPDQRKAAAEEVADLIDKGYRLTPACREVAKKYKVDDEAVSYKTIERAFKAEAAAKNNVDNGLHGPTGHTE